MHTKFLLIILLILLAIEYYTFVAVKTVLPSNSGLFYTLITVYLVLSIVTSGSFFVLRTWSVTSWPSPGMKVAVNILIGFFIGKILVTAIMLAGDIVLLVQGGIKLAWSYIIGISPDGYRLLNRPVLISQIALVCGALLTSSLIFGMSNKYKYMVRHVKVDVHDLPEGLKGLRIAQISDIHSGSFDDSLAVAEGVHTLTREKPDIILFTGDLVNYKADEIEPYLNIFKQLKAPLGIYSVMGNHDYGDYASWPSEEAKLNNLKQLYDYHKLMGWELMLNDHVILQRNGHSFALIGVENWSSRANFTSYGDLQKAMSGIKNSFPLMILMSHDPSHWDEEVLKEYPEIDLTLSGHTHGMQFGIELPGFKWSPVQYLYKRWAGLYKVNNQYLYVNRGYGFIGYTGRVGILPEITIINVE